MDCGTQGVCLTSSASQNPPGTPAPRRVRRRRGNGLHRAGREGARSHLLQRVHRRSEEPRRAVCRRNDQAGRPGVPGRSHKARGEHPVTSCQPGPVCGVVLRAVGRQACDRRRGRRHGQGDAFARQSVDVARRVTDQQDSPGPWAPHPLAQRPGTAYCTHPRPRSSAARAGNAVRCSSCERLSPLSTATPTRQSPTGVTYASPCRDQWTSTKSAHGVIRKWRRTP